MPDESNIGTMLAVAGLFAITFYLLRDPVGDAESAIIAAASCTGLTGATLTACQKAKAPAPKPKPITPAKPKPQGITAARPRGITAARPQRTQHSATGGGVGGPRTKAFECIQRGWKWRCYNNSYPPCRCEPPHIGPITAPSRNVLALNQCTKNATLYTNRLKKFALDKLAAQYGYQGLNPGEQLLANNAQTPSAGYQAKIINIKYERLKTDLLQECNKKYLGLDIIAGQNRGLVPRGAMDPKAGGVANPKAEKPLPPGVYPT